MMKAKELKRDSLLELVCLNSTGLVGPVLLERLVERFGSLTDILAASRNDLMTVDMIGSGVADAIKTSSLAEAEKEVEFARSAGVEILPPAEFPPGLKVIDGPPIVLYVKGTVRDEDAVAVALVGSRRCTVYGKNQAERLAYGLAERGMTIVSGMARGVDSFAHNGALKAGGRTIAVLGNGLSNVYPAENRKLCERIADSGAVVSEFPMRTNPVPGNFPRRNRIISGLSLGVVVVEAAEASGSLITARLAGEQGREVFAVPGRVGSPSSRGCHALIRDGAKLVEDVDDIIEELGALKDVLLPGVEPSTSCDDAQGGLLDMLSEDEELGIEDIIEKSGLAAEDVSSELVLLELKGLVKALPGKAFVKTQRL